MGLVTDLDMIIREKLNCNKFNIAFSLPLSYVSAVVDLGNFIGGSIRLVCVACKKCWTKYHANWHFIELW